uniref:Uncharacterized protein n=1 Tax=Romanomermis culicivorax TaxID=13658 RepID=A0A915JDI6_ROMCU
MALDSGGQDSRVQDNRAWDNRVQGQYSTRVDDDDNETRSRQFIKLEILQEILLQLWESN